MATPHSKSVISTEIDSFDSDLYDTIITKEKYCYDNSQQTYTDPETGTESPAGVDQYQPYFQDLSDAIVSWLNTSRDFPWEDYWQSFYSYILMYKMYGKSPGIYSDLHADKIFDMDDYPSHIKGKADDYYDDYYQEEGTDPDTGETTYTPHAPNLEADTSRINSSFTAPEKSDLDSLASDCQSVVQSAITDQLFKTEPIQNGPFSKRDMWMFIFGSDSGELNYEYWLNLFGQSSVVPEVDPP